MNLLLEIGCEEIPDWMLASALEYMKNALDVVQFTFHALTDLALRPSAYGSNPNRVVSPTFYLDHQA